MAKKYEEQMLTKAGNGPAVNPNGSNRVTNKGKRNRNPKKLVPIKDRYPNVDKDKLTPIKDTNPSKGQLTPIKDVHPSKDALKPIKNVYRGGGASVGRSKPGKKAAAKKELY
jgi:hypothetical protein